MFFHWLKNYMPRGLYGRAALILIVPIATILLVVSIVFIQRYYEDVTRQMTFNISLDLTYLVQQVENAPDLAAAQKAALPLQKPLALEITLPVQSIGPERLTFLDLSGRAMATTLRETMGGILAIDLLAKRKQVHLWVATRHGGMKIVFSRSRVSAKNPHQLLVMMVFLSLLMGVISIVFLRNQLRPIKRLASAAEAFGKGRVVDYTPAGAIEVRAAGGSFLDMRARIERQIEQRTMMLSGVSHDLRTPLTRLKLGLSMMEDGQEVVALKQDVESMEGLLDGFLDFARGDAGDELENCDPVALVAQAVKNAHRAGKNAKFLPVQGQEIGEVMLRPSAVLRALDNLIGNATRYGSQAEVGIALSKKALCITVEDDGPGIAPADREEALKPFARLEPARNQNKGPGVGLGLAIAMDVARSHGGSLRLGESASLGGLKVDLVLAR